MTITRTVVSHPSYGGTLTIHHTDKEHMLDSRLANQLDEERRIRAKEEASRTA